MIPEGGDRHEGHDRPQGWRQPLARVTFPILSDTSLKEVTDMKVKTDLKAGANPWVEGP